MVCGLIVSAGKQSRFHSDIPKALAKIDGQSLWERNIAAMNSVCDKVFTVCSFDNQHYFDTKDKIVINSGKGSGDAVWQALEKIDCNKYDSCFIMWGDTLHSQDIFLQLSKSYCGVTIVPCVYEQKPYVQVLQSGERKLSVKFSKFNEDICAGFHDLSLFYAPTQVLLEKLRQFRRRLLQENGTYSHKHGNEMEFMDVFNETDIEAVILECKDYKDFSFNTLDELQSLQKKGLV